MEVTIQKEPLAKAIINMELFKKELKNSFNLEKAVNNNMIVSDLNGIDEEKAREIIFLDINWGRIISLYNLSNKKEIIVAVHLATIKGITRYKPKTYDSKKGLFTFDEEKISDTQTLSVHTLIPLLEHHMESLIGNAVFDYSEKNWERIIYLE